MKVRPSVHLQQEPTECGLICLHAFAVIHGVHVDIEALKDDGFVSSRGLKISHICQVARHLGFNATAVAFNVTSNPSLSAPGTIVLVDGDHYVLVARSRRQWFDVFDPILGWRWVRRRHLLSRMSGLGVELAPGAAPNTTERLDSRLSSLTWILQHPKALRQLAFPLLAGLLGMLPLAATPWLTKNVVDAAATSVATTDAVPVVLAIVAVGLLSAGIAFLSAVISTKVSTRIQTALAGDLVSRVFRLPLPFFARQPPAVVVAKIKALDALRTVAVKLSSTALQNVVLGTLAIVLTYAISPTFALAAALAAMTTGLLGIAVQRYERAAAEAYIAAAQLHDVTTLDAISCMQPIQLSGVTNAMTAVLSRTQRLALGQQNEHETVLASARLAHAVLGVLYGGGMLLLGAYMLSNRSISVGDYVAIGAYSGMIGMAFNAVTQLFEARNALFQADGRLRALLRRAPAPADTSARNEDSTACIGAAIRVDTVTFAYSKFDPPVLDRFSMTVAAGESVAVVAPSGSGKSTLAKLLVGALTPSSGSIWVNGHEVSNAGTPASARLRVATVMQDDRLIGGTILDNIDLHRGFSRADVEQAARRAAIHDTIESLPMRYQTIVSDSFAGLSGGQRQRVLLARALIGNPEILVLDEATSALDLDTEQRIVECIADLPLTTVVFTHRQESIRRADRVIELPGGKKSARLATDPQLGCVA